MKKMIAISAALLALASASQAQLKKSVTWENINVHSADLPELGRVVPIHSEIGMESWWSVGCETLDRDYSNFENYKQFVGQTGVGYGRLQSGWAKTEPEKGKYDFTWLDAHVDGLIAQGVKPWICLCYGNPAYSDDGYDLNAKLFGEGKVMDAWDRYVAALVKRYKGKVSMYEVWNEPDGGRHNDSYETYAVLFDHTSKVIRKYDKNVKIAAFGICSPSSAASPKGNYVIESVKKMKELGCMDRMDYITYHAYYPIPEYINPAVAKLRSELDALGCKAELLQGETGCPGQLEYGHAMNTIEWNEYSQAKWDLRQMLNHFGMGIPYSVFTMVDLNYGWMMQSFGLVRMQLTHKPVYLRPKFYAVQNVTSIFTREMTPSDGVKVSCKSERDLRCIGVSKDGRTVGVLLWYCDQRPDGNLERDLVNLTLEGVTFDRPVYVDMMTGKVHDLSSCISKGAYEAGKVRLSKLPVWDAPVLIINRKAFNWK